ncbi:MAG: S8 family peptidase [Sumerlaeia bacterium]
MSRSPSRSLLRTVALFCLWAAAMGARPPVAGAQSGSASKSLAPEASAAQPVEYRSGGRGIQAYVALDRYAVETTDADGLRTFEVLSPGTSGSLKALETAASARRSKPLAIIYPTARAARDGKGGVLTRRVAVKPKPGVDVGVLAAHHGARVAGPVEAVPGAWTLEPASGGLLAPLDLVNALAVDREAVEYATPLIARQHAPRFVANDPLFPNQWSLLNTGQGDGVAGEDARVSLAWADADGNGVVVAITDDGLEWDHPDLRTRYRPDLSYDFNSNDADPSPKSEDAHGTSCAGVAAATGGNGQGISGAAPFADLAGIRLIAAPTTDEQDAAAFAFGTTDTLRQIHIKSNSWGPEDDGQTLNGPEPLAMDALLGAIREGRGGRGTIFMWAAGNGRAFSDSINADGFASSRYTLAVGASTNRGGVASYGEMGAAIVVNAPSSGGSLAMTTTDLTGRDGIDRTDYRSNFGGTSAACPLAAGVVALMLQVNPELTWRDVQHLLIVTATQNDPANPSWFTNGAGLHFSHDFGFGRIDAQAAVAMARDWPGLRPEAEPLIEVEQLAFAIPDNSAEGITRPANVEAPPGFVIEHVEVVGDILHTFRGDLRIELTSPQGTTSTLMIPREDGGSNYMGWTFTSVAHWGEDPAGEWRLRIADEQAMDVGALQRWELRIYGRREPVPQKSTWAILG